MQNIQGSVPPRAYAPRFAHAIFQFLGSKGDNIIEWNVLFILVIISTILMLMTTFAQQNNLLINW
jgi:hypothetical protein